MAFIHGKDTVLLGDSVALTGYLTQADAARRTQVVNTTTFGNSDMVYLAGIGEGSLTLAGLFDASASASHVTLNATVGAASGMVVTVGHGGTTIGNPVTMLQARNGSYNLNGSTTDAVRLNATFDADGGVRGGVSLHALSAKTGAGDYASVDNTSSTAFGGAGHLHVTAFTGTNCTIKIQHSTDDAVWVDLISFTAVTGATQQRSTVAGTVNRYLRAQISGGTFSSVTFLVAFARNLH